MESINVLRKSPNMFKWFDKRSRSTHSISVPRQKAGGFLAGSTRVLGDIKPMMENALAQQDNLDLVAANFDYTAQDYSKAWSIADLAKSKNAIVRSQRRRFYCNSIIQRSESYYHKAQQHCGDKPSIQSGLNTVQHNKERIAWKSSDSD